MRKVQHGRNFFPLNRGGKGPCLGLISGLWRSHDEGKVVGKLLGGMASPAGTSRVEVVGEGMEQLLLALARPPAKSQEPG